MNTEETTRILTRIKDNINFEVTDSQKKVDALNEAIQKLKQEPKTGHWIQTNEFFINQDGQFIYKFICSECKSLSYFRKSNKKAIGANVCPNCGAKMVEEQKGAKNDQTER